jgi:hypothetical protein
MMKIGNLEFGKTPEECRDWEPTVIRRCLHRQVMCIARSRVEGAWAAYCFPVPGHNHDDEEYIWKNEGAKLGENIAKALFPQFDGIPYAG